MFSYLLHNKPSIKTIAAIFVLFSQLSQISCKWILQKVLCLLTEEHHRRSNRRTNGWKCYLIQLWLQVSHTVAAVVGVWVDLLLRWIVCSQPESDFTRARSVFERCVRDSSLQTPGGAARGWQRVAGEVQRQNAFNSSVVKLCLRRSKLLLVCVLCYHSVTLQHYVLNVKKYCSLCMH